MEPPSSSNISLSFFSFFYLVFSLGPDLTSIFLKVNGY
jgi:hypothetical protein